MGLSPTFEGSGDTSHYYKISIRKPYGLLISRHLFEPLKNDENVCKIDF